MASGEEPVRFVFPTIHDNPNGWGPCTVPEQFRDTPYQPFSKDDRLGKVADWTGNLYQDRRTANKYGGAYGAGGQSQTYVWHREEDENTFRLVDTSRPQRPQYQRGRLRTGAQVRFRRDRDIKKDESKKVGWRQQPSKRKTKVRRSRRFFRSYYDRNGPQLKPRLPSKDVRSEWEVVREITFPEVTKLNYNPGPPQELYKCGSVGYYDIRKEKSVSVKFPQKLAHFKRVFHTVTTTDDPIIKKFAKECSDCRVFATDAILATLMTCSRSMYSWDIVVERVGDYLFLDKRDDQDSRFDFLTVSETAKEPPQEETGINTPQNLAVEATYINQNFSQQMLMNADFYDLPNENPFREQDTTEEIASVMYRYRKFHLKDGVGLVVRCEHSAALPPSSHGAEPEVFVNIHALNEWDPKHSGGNHADWRRNLDRQRGAVFATELKNNNCKIAKWAMRALLAGSSFVKFGYVSRINPNETTAHEILGIQTERPGPLASQLALDVGNAWGILHAIIDYCRELPPGKYLIMKDPNKTVVRIYSGYSDGSDSGSEESGEEND